MTLICVIAAILFVLILLYVLSTACRKGHPGLKALQNRYYAHRGLHGPGIPENSMAAFQKALSRGYGIELDVHLMADGTLAVIHDHSLQRTAGVDKQIEDLTLEDLAQYPLENTQERIPTFQQVLELYNGQAPLIVELKPSRGNHAQLTAAVCELLDGYCGAYCIESFDPRCIRWLKKHRPQVLRGQLSENFVHNKYSPLPWILKFILTHQMENFLTRPDFIAYKFADRNNLSNFLVRKLWKAQGVTWTLTSCAELDAATAEGWLPIFEGFEP